jgi:multidrug resistance efflux pump
MVPGFHQTTRALRADRGVARVLVGVFVVLLVAWGAWMGAGEVTLYETASLARVRADGVARLRVPVGGRVVAQPVRLGQEVAPGALLLALDDAEAALGVAVAEAELAALVAQQAARVEERDATGASRAAAEAARAADQAAARAAVAEAEVLAQAARRRVSEVEGLVAADAASAGELATARSELAAQEARVSAMVAKLQQSAGERSEVVESGTAAAVRERQDDEALDARIAAARAELRRATEGQARHRLTSPVGGRVGELTALVPGQLITENTLAAVIVPDTELVVEARFAPERAAGRLMPGQSAQVRIVGAGGQGARPAEVREVGSEPGADGLVTVVLGFSSGTEGLHHGLVAEVEVEVETVAPATVLLRAAGRDG